MNLRFLLASAASATLIAGFVAYAAKVETSPPPAWNSKAAAQYLDHRETWWQSWPMAQRDHGTVCISCHSVVPYALARPVLRQQMGETELTAPERVMYNNVVRRVTLWKDMQPFYNDAEHGANKSIESRTAEVVLNAVILSSHDARTGHLSEIAKQAFDEAWAMQRTTGPKAGSWLWLNFHNSPWEGEESEYHGNSLAALAVGMAPDNYKNDPKIRKNVELLRGYLRREYKSQPLINKTVLLWASSKLPGLLTAKERTELVDTLFAIQQADGGWSLSQLGTYKRRDDTPLETKSDGYATGLITLALEENGWLHRAETARGLAWLRENQSPTQGLWQAWSLNKKRDPDSDVGRFMSDAATGYAVLALEGGR